jgi:hypothetical protein
MPLETVVDVFGDANIMALRIGIAATDVHEPVASASHAIATGIERAVLNSWEIARFPFFVRSSCLLRRYMRAKNNHKVRQDCVREGMWGVRLRSLRELR